MGAVFIGTPCGINEFAKTFGVSHCEKRRRTLWLGVYVCPGAFGGFDRFFGERQL